MKNGKLELNVFFTELTDSVESLSGIADQYGSDTLALLMYLQMAILNDSMIEVFDGDSVLTVISQLPSANEWMEYIEINYS